VSRLEKDNFLSLNPCPAICEYGGMPDSACGRRLLEIWVWELDTGNGCFTQIKFNNLYKIINNINIYLDKINLMAIINSENVVSC
jgi:hypothetical protein